MKVNRQRKILELVNRYSIETQDDLIDRLMTEGYAVTQATISRDIRELQLTKVLTGKGTYPLCGRAEGRWQYGAPFQ